MINSNIQRSTDKIWGTIDASIEISDKRGQADLLWALLGLTIGATPEYDHIQPNDIP